ncbi:MAG: transketolase [Rickettsiales bacterium]|nr:transketolase [Rickettsiales bacterium]
MTQAMPTPTDVTEVHHHDLANAIRALSMDAVQKANSGHPGMPMGMADVAAVLYADIIKFNPKHPNWPDRDRFVLSAGHGSMLQYALHHLTGYEDMTIDQIKNFRQMGSKTAGHPEYGHAEGIETTTGPLGQGIANAVGMALAERLLNAEYGDELVDHYTYVIAGDGCLMEGISHEAISMAGHLKLNKLIVLFDDNHICIDGPTDMTVSDNQLQRFEACGWDTKQIDGHDPIAIATAIFEARVSDKPSLIACKTTIAKGAPTKAGTSASHGAPLGDDEIAGARAQLEWPHEPFEIPEAIRQAWLETSDRCREDYENWVQRFDASDRKDDFSARIAGELPEGWQQAVQDLKKSLAEAQPKEATRKSSQNVLDAIVPHVPAMIGGSADLTGSNNTKAASMTPVTAPEYAGKYVYYGVREHAMAAAMNGLALHGGFIPYGGTFLVFTDYCRPSIRLSALMEQRAIYVMTHDSIGLGEDGPTHQPVEHMAALRAIPNLQVFRPSDATEVAECWALAIASQKTPSVLALSRQGMPHLRGAYTQDNLSAYGAYTLCEHSDDDPQVVLIGTGSETHLCVEAAKALREKGKKVRVVSMPCGELFEQQPESYQDEVLGGDAVPKVACEAAIRMGWDHWIGRKGGFVGMKSFGASAPASDLYKHFGITAEEIVKAALERIA